MAALLDVRVTFPPEQKVVAPLGLTVGTAGIALTVIVVAVEGLVQPMDIILSEYVPEAETVMDCVVAPLFQ